MNQSPVPVAVIGVGEHGRNHARQYQEVAGAELVGVYDVRPERSRQVAADLGVRAFGSVEETLEEVRAVSVVIPTTDHATLALKAFDRGVDVLLEKPVSRTLEEADELVRRAEAEGRILQVGHVERFNPGVVAAKAATSNPLFFEVHRLGVFTARSLDVDVVFDLMIHDLDLVLWMVDAPLSDVRAVGLPVLSDKVDIANARVEFENGTVANLTASRVSTEKVRKFRYFQPHEYISIDFSRRDALAIRVERSEANPDGSTSLTVRPCSPSLSEAEGTAPSLSRGMGFRRLQTRPIEPLRAELEAFVDCVRTRQAPLVGGREGRNALALAERVMNCIEQHAALVGPRARVVPLRRAAGHSGEM